MIKKLSISLLAIVLSVFTMQAQELPQPSPYAEVMQRVGLTDVTIKYSRPGVKERTIFGELLDFGKIWRTGANSSTKIELSTDAKIGGKMIKAGTYSILSRPNEDGKWKVYINTDLGVQEGSYKAENNVAELDVEAVKADENTESLTFWFANVKPNKVDLMFAWANMMWTLPIEVEFAEMASKNIEDAIAETKNAFRVYNSSARYYLDNNMDLTKALEWSNKSVELDERFWNVYTKSLIQHAQGDKKGAIKTAKRSLELAEKASYQPYIKMNKENIEKWSKK